MKKNFGNLIFVFLLVTITVILVTTEPLQQEYHAVADVPVSRYGNIITGRWGAIDITELLLLSTTIEQSTTFYRYEGYTECYAQSELIHLNGITGRRVETDAYELLESVMKMNICDLLVMRIVYFIYNGNSSYKYVHD